MIKDNAERPVLPTVEPDYDLEQLKKSLAWYENELSILQKQYDSLSDCESPEYIALLQHLSAEEISMESVITLNKIVAIKRYISELNDQIKKGSTIFVDDEAVRDGALDDSSDEEKLKLHLEELKQALDDCNKSLIEFSKGYAELSDHSSQAYLDAIERMHPEVVEEVCKTLKGNIAYLENTIREIKAEIEKVEGLLED